MKKIYFSFLIFLVSWFIAVPVSLSKEVRLAIKYCKEWQGDRKIALSIDSSEKNIINKFTWKFQGTGRFVDLTGNELSGESTKQNEIFFQLAEQIKTSESITFYAILSQSSGLLQVIKKGPFLGSEILAEIRQAQKCLSPSQSQKRTDKTAAQPVPSNEIKTESGKKMNSEVAGVPAAESVKEVREVESASDSVPDQINIDPEQGKIVVLKPAKYKLKIDVDKISEFPVDNNQIKTESGEKKNSEVADILVAESIKEVRERETQSDRVSIQINIDPEQEKIVVLKPAQYKIKIDSAQVVDLLMGDNDLAEQKTSERLLELNVSLPTPKDILAGQSEKAALRQRVDVSEAVFVVKDVDTELNIQQADQPILSSSAQKEKVEDVPAGEDQDEREAVQKSVKRKIAVPGNMDIESSELAVEPISKKRVKKVNLTQKGIPEDEGREQKVDDIKKTHREKSLENLEKSLF